jgi:hypothetical protein
MFLLEGVRKLLTQVHFPVAIAVDEHLVANTSIETKLIELAHHEDMREATSGRGRIPAGQAAAGDWSDVTLLNDAA